MSSLQKLKKLSTLIISLLFLVSCEKDNEDQNLVVVKTVNAEVYNTGGVNLIGELSSTGSEEIIEFGFELIAHSTGKLYKSANPISKGKFETEINQNLLENFEYTYSAYAIAKSGSIYRGEKKTFFSRGSATPILGNITPNLAHIGDTVKLSGDKFGNGDVGAILRFGNIASTILKVEEKEIEFIVPRPATNNRTITLEISNKSISKNDILDLYTPIINDVYPSSAFFGDTIKIIGNHFNRELSMFDVKIENEPATIISSSQNEIEIVVPTDLRYGDNNSISVFSQNVWATSDKFSLSPPEFIDMPDEYFLGDYFNLKVNKTFFEKNLFYIGDNYIHPTILDEQTFQFYFSERAFLKEREHYIRWSIDDSEFISPRKIKIMNPFIRIATGYSDIPFKDNFAFTRNGKGFVLGDDIAASGGWTYIYQYDDVTNTWSRNVRVENIDGFSAISIYNGSYTYTPNNDLIYGLRRGSYGLDLISIDVNTGELLRLDQDLPFDTLGTAFSNGENLYFTAGPGLNEIWNYNITSGVWQMITNLPFISYRGGIYNAVVKDGYVYVCNGEEGINFSDFWRMNLQNYQWERLADNPNPVKIGAAYTFNNEIHFANDGVWKYDISTNTWSKMEKSGFSVDINVTKFSQFIHNGIPYLITDSTVSFSKVVYLHKGDLVK